MESQEGHDATAADDGTSITRTSVRHWTVEYVAPPPPWEAGRQAIINSTGARVPERTFRRPVPIVARITWEQDGEEQLETEALG